MIVDVPVDMGTNSNVSVFRDGIGAHPSVLLLLLAAKTTQLWQCMVPGSESYGSRGLVVLGVSPRRMMGRESFGPHQAEETIGSHDRILCTNVNSTIVLINNFRRANYLFEYIQRSTCIFLCGSALLLMMMRSSDAILR